MYTGRYRIFTAENISVQVLLRHACSIFEELKKLTKGSDKQLNLG